MRLAALGHDCHCWNLLHITTLICQYPNQLNNTTMLVKTQHLHSVNLTKRQKSFNITNEYNQIFSESDSWRNPYLTLGNISHFKKGMQKQTLEVTE